MEAFTFHDKGFVISVGTRRGVADIAASPPAGTWPTCSRTPSSGNIVSQSGNLRGWDPVAR